MRQEPYTENEIRCAIHIAHESLFSVYKENKPIHWSCDLSTKDFICISTWLDQEMRRLGLDDLGRITQNSLFDRRSRSEENMIAIAVDVMNDVINDRIDRFRRPHRRWG